MAKPSHVSPPPGRACANDPGAFRRCCTGCHRLLHISAFRRTRHRRLRTCQHCEAQRLRQPEGNAHA